MTQAAFLLAVAAIGLASAAQGLTGFGFSVIAVPLLLLVTDPLTVVVVALVLSLILTATLLPSTPGKLAVRSIWPLFAASLGGALVGAALLPHVSGPWLRPAMGFAAFAGGIAVVFGRNLPPFPRERAALAATGVVSGLMNGFASLSGPPVAVFALRQRWPADQARKTLLAYSLFVNVAALIPLVLAHVVTLSRLGFALRLIPVVLAGRLVGQHGSRRMPAAAWRGVTVGLVLLCGFAAMGQSLAAALH